ncbi:MAG TPA: 5-oxoprolinase subunit PxpB [Acetobacteraceae bacterium]|nr:5-oxoprolinase subunit PxpB [Acetobacteraceae bacterium]
MLEPVTSPAPTLQSPYYPRFLPVGDAALTVEFGDAITPELNARVVALDIALAAAELGGIVETAPSYRSLLICYEPLVISFRQLVVELRRLLSRGVPVRQAAAVAWTVPVVYDPPHAVDLPEVAQRLGLTEQQVITLHGEAEYQVYMVGFAPGLPYLGPLPARLHISRRENPRPQVPAGAVMIGGIQANIVPMPVPSAWYVLGQTPLRLFDPTRQDPFLFRAGDRLRFRRIDAAEFGRLAGLTTDALLPLVRVPA